MVGLPVVFKCQPYVSLIMHDPIIFNGCDTFTDAIRIVDNDLIAIRPVLEGDFVAAPAPGDTRREVQMGTFDP